MCSAGTKASAAQQAAFSGLKVQAQEAAQEAAQQAPFSALEMQAQHAPLGSLLTSLSLFRSKCARNTRLALRSPLTTQGLAQLVPRSWLLQQCVCLENQLCSRPLLGRCWLRQLDDVLKSQRSRLCPELARSGFPSLLTSALNTAPPAQSELGPALAAKRSQAVGTRWPAAPALSTRDTARLLGSQLRQVCPSQLANLGWWHRHDRCAHKGKEPFVTFLASLWTQGAAERRSREAQPRGPFAPFRAVGTRRNKSHSSPFPPAAFQAAWTGEAAWTGCASSFSGGLDSLSARPGQAGQL